jgi:hypothetical protein
MTDKEAAEGNTESAMSLVGRVLTSFIATVAQEEGYDATAARLKTALLDKRDLSEACLQRALFEVEQP